MLQSFRNLKIGKNNVISKLAIIYDNVTIGDNNFIGDNVIIYPNTKIGNYNNIFNGNIIGEYPVSSDDKYKTYNLNICKGVEIGNNNLLHIKNLIFSGIDNKTYIGNNNKLLAENHVGHDSYVTNNVTFYPRVIQGGYSIYLDNSNIGMNTTIQQKCVVGQYSMVGGNNMITKNVFPYFINIANKIHRINKNKTSSIVNDNEIILRKISEDFYNKKLDLNSYEIPENIKNDIELFIQNCDKFHK
jgi:acyl-[acyl carrier protein]--UDP-N-acetylglucosamine O-acyltransferase